ncbi:hypothetical protein EJB05_35373, partial [Eragrostis curvula]
MAMMPPSSTSSVNPFSAQSYEMARPRIDIGDADAILEELGRRGEEANGFENFHHYELDAHKRLKHLF